MKSEGLAPIIRALYHAIEILTVFLMLFIFVLQLVTPMYAVQSGNASALLAALQWVPYRPGVLTLAG